jgi:predicted PurR-regulated permease PerM
MSAASLSNLTRSTLQLLFVGVLIGGSFWVLRPFIIPLAWAATIVVASWPVFQRMQSWLGGHRGLAVGVMTLGLLLVLVVPLYLAITTIVENAEQIANWSRTLAALAVPQPPPWLARIPLVGGKLAARWQELGAAGSEDLAARVFPYARTLVSWFAGQVGGIGLMVVEFLLTVVIAAILYTKGEEVARGAARFAFRLGGSQGEDAVQLAAQAVRAVALGVVVTAVAQSCLGGIGLAIAGVPFAAVLTAVMLICGVAQLGPTPVLIPAVIWTYWSQGVVWGSVLLVWSAFVGVMDNVLRPLLIKRGADLPLLLIFTGVLGGLVAFGVIGLFLGPVVLAVAYTLLVAWVEDSGATPPQGQTPAVEKDHV